jgi:hypothetical protein
MQSLKFLTSNFDNCNLSLRSVAKQIRVIARILNLLNISPYRDKQISQNVQSMRAKLFGEFLYSDQKSLIWTSHTMVDSIIL